MNKRAAISDVMISNIIFLLLLAMFMGTVVYFSVSQKDGAGVWADFYAKEIVKVVDGSLVGEEIIIEFQDAYAVAHKNAVSLDKIVTFDNEGNLVCVQLTFGNERCFRYYNDVDITKARNLPTFIMQDITGNKIIFKVVERGAG